MSDDPAQNLNVCRSDASWAAVREARRAVNVAWVSTIVNALVVAVAVAAPFLQQFADAHRAVSMRESLKRQMFLEIKREIDEVATTSSPIFDLGMRPEEIVGPSIVAFSVDVLKLPAADMRRDVEGLDRRYQFALDDFDLWQILERRRELYLDSATELERAISFISNAQPIRADRLESKMNKAMQEVVHNLRDLRLFYTLNVDASGNPKAGELILADCDDAKYRTQCSQPVAPWDVAKAEGAR